MIKRRFSAYFRRIVNIIQYVLLVVFCLNLTPALADSNGIEQIFVTPNSQLMCNYDVLGNDDPVTFSAVWCEECSAKSIETTQYCDISTDENGNCVYYAECKERGYQSVVLNPNTPNLYCEPIQYEIVYQNMTGALNNSNNKQYFTIKDVENGAIIQLYDPSKTDHTFKGWFTDSSLTTQIQYITDIPQSSDGKVYVYANWMVGPYNIVYNNMENATNDSRNPSTYTGDTLPVTLYDATRYGYTFDGWYTDPEFTAKINSIPLNSTGTKQLYAKWTAKEYVIEYHNVEGATNNNPIQYTADDLPIILNSAVKAGYTFNGWYKDYGLISSIDRIIEIPQNGTTKTDVYAKWTPNRYTTTFVCGEGQGTSYSFGGLYGNSYSYTVPKVLSRCQKPGYSSNGWDCVRESDGVSVNDIIYEDMVTPPFVIQVPDNVICTAQYEQQNYTLTFKDIDEDGVITTFYTPAPLQFTVEQMPFNVQNTDISKFGYTENPIKTGYTFKNWCRNSNKLSSQCSNNMTITVPQNGNTETEMVLWANWTPNTYKVLYKCNDNDTYAAASRNATFDMTFTPAYSDASDICSKPGFSFEQWSCYNDTNASSVDMTEAFVWNIASNVTCVAEWSEHTFNISFNSNSPDVVNPAAMADQGPCSYTKGCSIQNNKYINNGYLLEKWTTQQNGGGVSYEPNAVVKEQDSDITLYAQWKAIYTDCDPGYYLPAGQYGTTSCRPCEISYFCPGSPEGGWPYNSTEPQGKNSCVEELSDNNATTLTERSVSKNDCILQCSPYLNGTRTGYVLNQRGGRDGYYRYDEDSSEVCKYSARIQYVGVDSGYCPEQTYVLPSNSEQLELCRNVGQTPGKTFLGWTDNTGRNYLASSLTSTVNAYNLYPDNGVVTMTAQWEKHKYTVTYNCNNADGNVYLEEDIEFESSYTLRSSNICSNPGHTFNKWECDIDYTGNSFNMPASNVVCSAKWNENTYDIVFNGNGADSGTSTESMTGLVYDQKYNLNANGFVKTGFEFKGWCKDWNLTTETCSSALYSDKQSVSALAESGTVTLYAVWDKDRYSINYYNVPNGFENNNPSYFYVDTDTFVLKPATKAGYTFKGWCTDATLQTCSLNQTVVKGTSRNLDFYLKYDTNTYNIYYKNTDGTDVEFTSDVKRTFTVDETFNYPRNVSNQGYTLVNWYKDSNLRNITYGIQAGSIASDVTIYARWNANNSKLIYHCDNDNNNNFIQNGKVGDVLNVINSDSCGRPYYTVRWTCDGETYLPMSNITLTKEEINCYPQWTEEESYTIIYMNTEDATLPTDIHTTYKSSEGYTFPTSGISKSGYTFKGWYKDANLRQKTYSIEVGTTGPVTVYARWAQSTEPTPVVTNGKVSYYCDPATGIVTTEQMGTVGATVTTIDAAQCNRPQDNLIWLCNGLQYPASSNITISAENIACYAQWTSGSDYTIIYMNTEGATLPTDIHTTYKSSEGYTFPTSGISKSGYTFKGWYKDANLRQKTYSIEVGTTGPVTVYARWAQSTEPTPVVTNGKVSYYCDPATGIVTTEQMGTVGSTVTTIDAAQCNRPQDNLIWLCNGLQYPASSNITISAENIACYAQWTSGSDYTIIYMNTEDATLPTDIHTTYKSSEGYTFPTSGISKSGYTFKGWYKDANLRQKTYSIEVGTTGTVTVYARWSTNSYKIDYTCPDGTVISETVKYETSLNVQDLIAECPYVPGVEPEGIECDDVLYEDKIVVPNENIECQVIYTYEDYNISYKYVDDDKTEYDLNLLPKTYTANTPTFTLPTAEIEGREFVAWCETSKLTNCSDNMQITKGSTGDITVYAKTKTMKIDCLPGYYIEPGSTECNKPCEPGKHCDGGEYPYDPNKPQGTESCPEDYPLSDANAESENDCYKLCPEREHYTVTGKWYKNRNECVYTQIPGCPQDYYMNSDNECLPCASGMNSDGGYATECGCKTGYSLQTSVNSVVYPTSSVRVLNSSVLDALTWHVDIDSSTWMHSEANGKWSCRNKGGSVGKYWNDANDASIAGSYCWCAMSEPYETKYVDAGYQNGSNCSGTCAQMCGERIKTNPSVRKAIFASAYEDGSADYETNICLPNSYIIVLNDNGGNGGTGRLYELYDNGFYIDSEHNISASYVNIPVRDGYKFVGYFENIDSDTAYIDANGLLLNNMTPTFAENKVLYAKWTSNKIDCLPGYYIEPGSTECNKPCEPGKHCDGGEYPYDPNKPQGTESCPEDYPLSDANAASVEDCFKSCPEKPDTTGVTGGIYHNGINTCVYEYECASGKWLHIGNNDKVCLSENKLTSPALVFDINGHKYYLGLTENSRLPVNKDSTKKMHVEYGRKSYNAHDATVM